MATATDKLRRMLDERGVEWDELVGHPVVDGTEWHDRDGCPCTALEHADDIPVGLLSVQACLTPEQAIEATLGNAYEPPLAAHWDGDTLTLTIPRDPSCIRVQRSAEQPCKVYADESKVIAATLGRDECRMLPTAICSAPYTEIYECDQCGAEVMVSTVMGEIEEPNFCPNCGAKVVDE